MAKQTFTTGQVLTAAQMTDLQQTAMGGGSATAKTASYTLVAADAGATVLMNSGSATTITVNTSLFASGDSVYIQNLGAGVCTVTAGTATVNTSSSLALAQYEGGTLYFTSASAAIFLKGAGAAVGGGKTWSLLNAGGTALTGATSITVGSISNKDDILLLFTGASSVNASSGFSVIINSDTGSNYDYSGAYNFIGSTYAVTNFTAQGSVNYSGGFLISTMGNSSLDQAYGSVLLSGCKSSNMAAVVQGGAEGTNNQAWQYNGMYHGSAALTSITIRSSSGNFDNGTVYVWGA